MILIYAECGEYSDYRFEVLGYVEETSFDNIEKGCRAGVLELLKRHPELMHWNLVIRAPRTQDFDRWVKFDRKLDNGGSRRMPPGHYGAGSLFIIPQRGVAALDHAPDEDDWIVSWTAPEKLT